MSTGGRFAIILLAWCVVGAGCYQLKDAPKTFPTPQLSVRSPQNGDAVSDAQTNVVGTTNMDNVFVNGVRHDVNKNTFAVPIDLTVGPNTIDITAGNGFTTSTKRIEMTRAATSTKP